MKLPVEVDSRGKRNNDNDPMYFVLTDADGREVCDTLNCHHLFTIEEQREHLEQIAKALNAR